MSHSTLLNSGQELKCKLWTSLLDVKPCEDLFRKGMQPWVLKQDPYLCALHATFGDAICIWTAITLLLQEGRIEAQPACLPSD